MSMPYTRSSQDAKLESLGTQHEFLKLLRLRHLNWMNSADTPRIKQYHREIADLIEQITTRYTRLLEEPPPSR
jgi:hypothetical protein